MSPDDMAGRVIYYYERQLSTAVNDIEHIESQSLPGVGIVKIFFQPGVDIRTATAQVTSLSQTVLKQMPPGITPPLILNYNASTVPILQLGLSSPALAEQDIFDLGQNFIRPSLASVPGRGDSVALWRQGTPDPDRPRSAEAAGRQSVRRRSGECAGGAEPDHSRRHHQGRAIRIQRKAQQQPQRHRRTEQSADQAGERRDQSICAMSPMCATDSRRSAMWCAWTATARVLMTVLKSGSASTLDIVDNVKAILPRLKQTLPKSLKVVALDDQSIFVRAAISGVVQGRRHRRRPDRPDDSAVPGKLAFHPGDRHFDSAGGAVFRRAAVGAGPDAEHHDLGRAGAGGGHPGGRRHRHDREHQLASGKGQSRCSRRSWTAPSRSSRRPSFRCSASASPLCRCSSCPAFPAFFSRPMAKAVVFAMIGSFILSRTLVPTMANYLLVAHGDAKDVAVARSHDASEGHHPRNPLVRLQHGFEQRFEKFRGGYHRYLTLAMERRGLFAAGFLAFALLSLLLVPFLGRNFFPAVDAGEISLHVRAPIGTRIEETAALFDHVEARIRQVIPPDQLGTIVDNIGLPVSRHQPRLSQHRRRRSGRWRHPDQR